MPARRFALILALAALPSACGRDFVVETWVSDEFQVCAPADTACDPLALLAVDSALLAQHAAADAIDAAGLARVTGVPWREQTTRGAANRIRLGGVNPLEERRAAWVLERVRTESARDTVLSIASNGGTTVWLNGALLGQSRSAARPARAHQDLYTVPLRAGTNVLSYRVVTGSVDAQLHREWHDAATLGPALAASIEQGAYADLPRSALLADTATAVLLDPPQVRLSRRPMVSFRWQTLLGEPLAGGSEHTGAYPESLPLPAGFPGMAVLEVSVSDGGQSLYLEEIPIFRDSTAARLARALAADTSSGDPVRSARVDAVRTLFGMGADTAGRFSDWQRTHALADLYRHVRQPGAFHRYPGPQIWGYRAADGTVQPYWLTVPPAALAAPSGGGEPGLVFSFTHHVDSSFWRGRGRSDGWVVHMATLSTMNHNFSVLPHLRGGHDFDRPGVEELAAIVRQVDSVFPLDTGAVAILAWSAHAVETVEMAQHRALPLARVGFAVPALHDDPAALERALAAVHAVRPALQWTLWRAADDDRIPRERSEGWVKAIRRAGFDVAYHEVPFSTHLGGFFHDVEAELHRQVSPIAAER